MPPTDDTPVPPTDSLRIGFVTADFMARFPPLVGKDADAVFETFAVDTVTA